MAAGTARDIQLEPSWKEVLGEEFEQPYMLKLSEFLRREKSLGKHIYPAGKQIFNALNTTSFDEVSVVIIGQDPYHGPGQAHGLCFSVLPGVQIPPSLRNIYKELESDVGFTAPAHGCLIPWAQQGVLLLNATLTVEAGKAGSHQGKGWEQFTDRVIDVLSERKTSLAFLLWGSYAQKKGANIDRSKHLVLQSPHPSPLSASRGFFGNQHFSRVNDYLTQQGREGIDWQLPMDTAFFSED